MNNELNTLLKKYRDHSKTEREKGEYFELLSQDFLKNDPVLAQQYSEVWTYSKWAELQGIDKRDTGIDLVAKLADEEGYCAIQCKFYDEDHRISKKDIDSFFTASGKAPFTRRLIIDTTSADWSEHAEDALVGQSIPVNRIGLSDLEQSPIDWSAYAREQKVVLKEKKSLFPHQQRALKDVQDGLTEAERGKLVMACGTGKTFTSLKIAETLAGKGKRVLYLVPSLALMSQTVREWSNDTKTPLHSFAVCSDVQVGKRKAKDDLSDINAHDLAFPATTDAMKLAEKMSGDLAGNDAAEKMTVVFSTYQSIQVISDAQHKYGMPDFDLIICDEAHRTTGAKLAGEDDSNFVKVHYQDYIKGKKRIYMTATPRIYGEAVKSKAKEVDAVLCSMDDAELFGETLHEITFSEAVSQGLLTDYKVIVLAVDEEVVSASVQKRLSNEHTELDLDDATKIIGCYRALTKLDLQDDLRADQKPMQRAVAFCNTIANSKLIVDEFSLVVEEYLAEMGAEENAMLQCEAMHVDGTYNAKEREKLIDWLNNVEDANTCHILSNARCLSEGVDVPALDAIMFMHPRKSQIDVVQSVGRVMRRAEGKSLGYVILPVGVPAGIPADEALNNNEKYKVVWQILNALRSHDDRFEAGINRIDLGEKNSRIEIVAVADTLPQRVEKTPPGSNIGQGAAASDDDNRGDSTPKPAAPKQTSFAFDEFSKAILARIVKKCGTRDYWEDWANDIADIAQKHISRIKGILKNEGKERKAFDAFLEEIRDDLNDSITQEDAIEMLAQHLITKPVFEALFEGYSFAKNNPVSVAMQKVLDVLDEHTLEKESESLQKFYNSVRRRAEGIESAEAKQRIVVQLYDKFFRNAFPRLTEKLGIVYTPVEVVDFIIHSVNDVLKSEFGQTLGSKGVHILDPFTGTGTFITRLLQSGLIAPEELPYKYENEIHANEIVLLAYYIAAINIEQVYHDAAAQDEGEYKPFKGICLTDTFQLYEKEDLVSRLLVDNSSRRQRQKELDIRVIIGNPPYSAGQKSENDNSANVEYKHLDNRIAETYVSNSLRQGGKRATYDSYIRAIRWGSDRIGESGVMSYVSNAGWIDGNAMDGMRHCLAEEYSSLYIFHLRGNQRTQGELSRKEGGKIFGSGSRAPIAISLFVKNPKAKDHGKIYFHDIGDYLSQKEKLDIIRNVKSIEGITAQNGWQTIVPDQYNDWINQRDESFDSFIGTYDKKDSKNNLIFQNSSSGVLTSRDAWIYNFSKEILKNNISNFIEFYNHERLRFNKVTDGNDNVDLNKFLNNDPKKISWGVNIKSDIKNNVTKDHDQKHYTIGIYRPFTKIWMYADKSLSHSFYSIQSIYPHSSSNDLSIFVNGAGSDKGFSCLMVSSIPNYHTLDTGQCFPLKLYEKTEGTEGGLFAGQASENGYRVKDGITDAGLAHFRAAYSGEKITKEDVFYYIYGLLHSEDYRARYADNLSKQLPRIPCVKTPSDFWAFSKAGRALAELHVNYETVEPYPVTYKEGALFMDQLKPADYRVEKMKFGKRGKETDKSTVIYNHKITMTDIPLAAYDYVVNGKPALEWVMERQGVKTDKASGIVNDANLYALETVGDAAYPLKLFQRVITVSLETMKIVRALPKLEIQEEKKDKAA
ncbi:MAG: DEAD/DEAH box helicase [Alphaproteobacteria bacterium]|nr:DEAD/DEAH box helicase [Alphaproteobacteria bacterium]